MKISKTYRLEKGIAEEIVKLQEFYSDKLGINVSQADVIKFLVCNEVRMIKRDSWTLKLPALEEIRLTLMFQV